MFDLTEHYINAYQTQKRMRCIAIAYLAGYTEVFIG